MFTACDCHVVSNICKNNHVPSFNWKVRFKINFYYQLSWHNKGCIYTALILDTPFTPHSSKGRGYIFLGLAHICFRGSQNEVCYLTFLLVWEQLFLDPWLFKFSWIKRTCKLFTNRIWSKWPNTKRDKWNQCLVKV